MADCTVLIVNQDNLDCLRLTVESFRRHNWAAKYLLWIWDNNSTDGSQEWARANCDRLFIKEGSLGHHHSEALDRMCKLVETPYTLTLDNDVLTTGPFLQRLVDELRDSGAFAASPEAKHDMGTVDHFGRLLRGQKRIDPCCALFDTHALAQMTVSVSFTPYECANLGKFYDTGGMVRAAAEGGGRRVLDLDWLWTTIKHYGSMTWAGQAPEGSPVKTQHSTRLEVVREDYSKMWDGSSRAFVVARYEEDVSWLDNETFRHGVKVINKGSTPIAVGDLPVVSYDSSNVGREAHTYAAFVATHYLGLAETTWFVQGRPFDHVPDFLEQARRPTAGFRALGPHRLLTGPNGDECHTGLPIAATYTELTGRPFPEGRIPFTPGACFAAHVSVLHRYPQEWWLRLANRLGDPETQSWMPWTMERLWETVLTSPYEPHRYHNVAGWFTDHKFYRDVVRGLPSGAKAVEVGCWHGRSMLHLATEVFNSGKSIELHAVDHFQGSAGESEQFMRNEAAAAGGSVRKTFEANMGKLLPLINVVQLPSVQASKLYEDESLDFVFIDAGHTEAEVYEDIVAWYPKIKKGAILAGHDFSGAWPGVERAVRRAFDNDFEFITPMSWKHIRPNSSGT